jgi:hypothetical protein
MTTDLTQLIQDFCNFFLNLYHQSAAPPSGTSPGDPTTTPAAQAPGGAFLAFEPIGSPLTPDMFKLEGGDFDKGLVVEQFSTLANPIPVLQGTSIHAPGLLTADGFYGSLLEQAQALPSADLGTFAQIKDNASKSYKQSVGFNRPLGGAEYHPAFPTPADFPLPSGTSAWASQDFKQTETESVSVPDPAAPHPVEAWGWRIAPTELLPALDTTEAVREVTPANDFLLGREHMTFASARVVRPALSQQALPSAAVSNVAFRTAAVGRLGLMARAGMEPMATLTPEASFASVTAVAPTASAPTFQLSQSRVLSLQVQQLATLSTPKSVTSKSMELSFDYCLVTAIRPWMDTAFLTSKTWYIPGSKAGDVASGAGDGNKPLEVIPVAAIVVKNLTIKADWSQDDLSVVNSFTKFGPFSLVGREFHSDTATLNCAGMQIVGWVFEPMPMLPPNSDPASS